MNIFKENPAEDIAHAEVAMQLRDWSAAVRRWQAILSKFKNHTPPDVYVRLSVAHRKQAEYDLAQAAVDQGFARFPDFLQLYIEHAEIATYGLARPEALKRWRGLIEKFGDGAPAKAWLKLSRAYRHERKLPSAERTIGRGLRRYPDDVDLKVEAARIASASQDWPKAARRWQAVLALPTPTLPETWLGLAKAQSQLGKPEAAEATLKQAVAQHPDEPTLHLELAELALTRRDWPVALKRWRAVLRRFGSSLDTSHKSEVRFNVSVLKRLVNIGAYTRQIKQHASSSVKRKIVIYTSVSKGYDTLKPPEIVDPRFDYVVYTDSPLDDLGIYDVRPLPEPNHEPGRAIRYPKTHAHSLFKGYDVAVWVDTSLMLTGDIYPIIGQFLDSGLAVGSCPHSVRQSVYEEFEACVALKKDDPAIMKRQMGYYRSLGFDNHDLAENGFLMFNLKHKGLVPAMETWWQQIVRFSKRDQLSFNFALSQHHLDWYRLVKPPRNIRTHPAFVVMPHHSEQRVLEELVKLIKSKPTKKT